MIVSVGVLAVAIVAAGPVLAQQQVSRDYRDALRLMWDTLYRDGGGTLYCDESFGRNKSERINVEHVTPMSWAAYKLRCGKRDQCRQNSEAFNRIEADLHNMWPSLKAVNKARRSYPFAVIKGEARPFKGCDIEIDDRRRVVEPRPASRGEIARSMFYMNHAYGIELRSDLVRTLRRWNHDDPVSAEERRRNDVIERLQGVRNPFIDDPSLVDTTRLR
jgi:deoxyribonuclease-1